MEDFLDKDELYNIAVNLPMPELVDTSSIAGQLQANTHKLLDHIHALQKQLQAAEQVNVLALQHNAKLEAELKIHTEQSATEFFWAERWAKVSDICLKLQQENLVQQQLLQAANLAHLTQTNVQD